MAANRSQPVRSLALSLVPEPAEARIDPPEPVAPSRAARRRAQTRASLLNAARQLFSRQGIETTRINEITELADVGFGSFYNHFESKEEIVEAVLRETVASQALALKQVATRIEDPAEVVAVAHRYFIRRAARDPEWAWLLVRIDASHRVIFSALEPFAMRDLSRGIGTGRFAVSNPTVALHASGGALLSVMRLVLEGGAPEDADSHHAEGVLRTLGLSPAEAAEVARRPLPPLE